MTLPASGTITFNNFNTEAGRASGTNIDMGWIYSNTKSGQQSYTISNYYSKAWYQRNQDGNCNNGNCTNNCNCGNTNCANCLINGTVNCSNCDTRSWFQNNCNCFSQCFNCTVCTAVSVNCLCDCVCCFPADALVRMADGSLRRIDRVLIGEKVDGGNGLVNNVIAYHKIKMGSQPMFTINGKHRTTREHRHWTTEGWSAIDLNAAAPEYEHEITVDNEGTTQKRKNIKLKDSKPVQLKKGMFLITASGKELIESIEVDWNQDPNQYVYTLICDGSHACIVNNIVVSAWARDDDFDYNTWAPKSSDMIAA